MNLSALKERVRRPAPGGASGRRLRSLDAFRGLTVAAMILVNSPGSGEVYAPLRHAEWHGFTPKDMVFPSFLVIMGAAAALSHAVRRERGERRRDLLRHALARAGVLAALGLVANAVTYGGDALRLPGVLQRIALCSVGVHLLLVLESGRAAAGAAAALLAGYAFLLARFAAPGFPAGDLSPEGSLATWLDRTLLGPRVSDRWGDPEGVLSTLGALATSLIGVSAGRSLLRRGPGAAGRLAAGGAVLAAAGLAWSVYLPLNKQLWTSSYALMTGGLSLMGIAALVAVVEGRPARWAGPFEALGRRALGAYVLAGLAHGVLEAAGVTRWLDAVVLRAWLPPRGASLAYAAALAAAASLVAQRLDRRQKRRLARGPEAEQHAGAG